MRAHVIVATLLDLEVIFIVLNGALLWLIFREREPSSFTAKQMYALADRLRRKRGT